MTHCVRANILTASPSLIRNTYRRRAVYSTSTFPLATILGSLQMATMASASEEVNFTTSGILITGFLPQMVSIAPIVVALFTGTVGTCANTFVLVVLVFARRHFGSHVNTLITNQAATDLAACICLTIGFSMMLPGTSKLDFGLGEVGNNLICYLFQSRILLIAWRNAGIIGLLIAYIWKSTVLVHNALCTTTEVGLRPVSVEIVPFSAVDEQLRTLNVLHSSTLSLIGSLNVVHRWKSTVLGMVGSLYRNNPTIHCIRPLFIGKSCSLVGTLELSVLSS